MPSSNGSLRNSAQQDMSEAEKYRRKLQRILRAADGDTVHLSGGVSPNEQRRMSEQRKAAMLAPRLLNPTAAQEDDGPLFQCTECDMIVKESDPYCPFCGAIFADGPLADQATEPQVHEDLPTQEPIIEKPVKREPMIRPEKFDLFSLIKTRPISKEMLYQEATKGFTGSARLIEELEHLVSEISSLGTDTTKARRLIGSAWEACRDGDWNLVQSLAHQTEDMVAPSIPELVRVQIAGARKHLTEAKTHGVDISSYVLHVKSAMQALRAGDLDEALRITKELVDSLREDAISWK